MGALYHRVAALDGWRRWGLAFVLGALAALALPPVYFLPLLVPAFCGLFWLTEGSPGFRSAAGVGWWFGFGHFLVGLYWVAIAFFTDIRGYDWLGPAAVLGLAAALAVFPAAATALVRLTPRGGPRRLLILAVCWSFFEWVRSWAFTGFPWNLIGSVWAFSDDMIQFAAIAGTYGLGLVTVAAVMAPALLAGPEGPTLRRGGIATGLAIGALVLIWSGGALRLAGAESDPVPGVRLRLVQPDIPQELKWVKELRGEHVLKQIAMSREPADLAPTHIIWGETMVPFALSRTPEVAGVIGRATPQGGVTIVGAPRTTPYGERPYRVWNSLYVLDDEGRTVATYDKSHLVPVGEYVPLRGILPIEKMTAGVNDFSAGSGPVTLRLPGLPPVSPLICYEVIFPGAVVNPADRPDWLLNLTNDSWYGHSSGPYQHFVAARLRAVEEGLPLVRVSNGGISGIVDGYGRVLASLGLGRAGVLDGILPAPPATPGPYARWGNLVWMTFAFLASGIIVIPSGNRRRIRS